MLLAHANHPRTVDVGSDAAPWQAAVSLLALAAFLAAAWLLSQGTKKDGGDE